MAGLRLKASMIALGDGLRRARAHDSQSRQFVASVLTLDNCRSDSVALWLSSPSAEIRRQVLPPR